MASTLTRSVQISPSITVRNIVARPPRYKVLLLNDDINMKKYVMVTLRKVIPDMTQDESYAKTMQAHYRGSATLRICDQPLAENYCEGLRINGLTSRMEPEGF